MSDDIKRLAWLGMGGMFDELAGVDVHERAAEYAQKYGRDEPYEHDYVMAARDAIDAAMKMDGELTSSAVAVLADFA